MESFILFHVKHINSCHFKPEDMYIELIDLHVKFVRLQRPCRLHVDSCITLRILKRIKLRWIAFTFGFTLSRTYVCRVEISSCRVGYYCLHKVSDLFIFKAHRYCFFWQKLFICHCGHSERQIPISSFAHREQMLLQESNQPIKPNKELCYLS